MQTLAIQSFGKITEYKRALLTIYSFFSWLSSDKQQIKVVLFTDNEEWFTKQLVNFDIHYVELTPQKIKHMRGEIDFLHRMKIALIEEAFALYPYPMFYADSDTFFISDPQKAFDRLTPNSAQMHLWEYTFDTMKDSKPPAGETFVAMWKAMNEKTLILANGTPIKVDLQWSSWNAGVMCLHPEHAKHIPDVYALTEQLFPITQNHATEQYAFSIILQIRTNLQSCDDVNYHYWYRTKKQIMDDYLNRQFNDSFFASPIEKRLQLVKEWTISLPEYLRTHLWTIQDNAIQAFNEDNFKSGYYHAGKSLLRAPLSSFSLLKDAAYHTKRWLLS